LAVSTSFERNAGTHRLHQLMITGEMAILRQLASGRFQFAAYGWVRAPVVFS
jgi:hypothetical protein